MAEPRKPDPNQPEGVDIAEINTISPGSPGDNGGFATADGDPMGAVPIGTDPPAEPTSTSSPEG